jgi:hypothetical protein
MPTYTATFRTDSGYAVEAIVASTPQAALAKAQSLLDARPDELAFGRYDDWGPVNEIEIADDDTFDLALWRSPDWQLRLAAPALLEAVKLALFALNEAPRFAVRHPACRDSYQVCAALEAALRKAEGA